MLRHTIPLTTSLLLLFHVEVGAQVGVSLTGKVSERGGQPVSAATVRVRAEASDAEGWALTDERGRYRLHLAADGGPLLLWVERVGYLSDTVRVEPGAVRTLVRDLAITPAPIVLPGIVVRRPAPEPPVRGRSPGGREATVLTALSGDLPVSPGSLSELAARHPGVRIAGDDPWGGGVSFGAQPASQTGVTVDGASFGAASLPEEAVQSVTVTGSAYDVSRGQFTGGQVAARTVRGTDLAGAAGTLWTTHPALQSRPSATGPERGTTLLRASGGVGGPLLPRRLYGFTALQVNALERASGSLEATGDGRLRSLGVEPDSAARFLAALSDVDAPRRAGVGGHRLVQGSGIVRLDFDLAERHALMVRLDGRGMRMSGVGESPLSVASATGEMRDAAGGVLVQATSRIGSLSSSTRGYHTRRSRSIEPLLDAPGGIVDVAVTESVESTGWPRLRFGGSPLHTSSESSLFELTNDVELPIGDRTLRAGVLLVEDRESQRNRFNEMGTFVFSTVDDLLAGTPSGYSRTRAGARGVAVVRHGALYLGETRRGAGPLHLIYGLRAEGRGYAFPEGGDGTVFEGREVGPPRARWGVSPRVGFTYQREGSPITFRGGVGEFGGRLSPSMLSAAAADARAERAALHLHCEGSATPAPEWRRFAADPSAIPASCADSGGGVESETRRLTVFVPGFGAPRAWRASAGTALQIRRAVYVHVDASLLRGVDQILAHDLNLPSQPVFHTSGEGRPVYAPASTIVPATGAISLAAVRPNPGFGSVREVGGGGRSQAIQLSIQASTLYRMANLSAQYTFLHAVDEVGPLPGFDGSRPLASSAGRSVLRGTADLERRHALRVQVSRARGFYEFGVTATLTSGAPYTPMVDRDVNGDGWANDPAFVFAPDAEVAGMRELLATVPGHAGRCLRRQMGSFAERNSCRAPWEAGFDLRINLYPGQSAFRHRWMVSALALNLPAGADRLLHGARPRGWGRAADPDPVLFRVDGFDPDAGGFRYRVNPRFGRRREMGLGGDGFQVILQGRILLGADPRRQPLRVLETMVRTQGRDPAELRRLLAERLPNLPAQVLGLDGRLGLGLTAEQTELLRTAAARLGSELAVLADSLAVATSVAERSEEDEARTDAQRERRALVRRTVALLEASVEELRLLLSAEQWERLPQAVREPSRQIVPAPSLFIPFGEP